MKRLWLVNILGMMFVGTMLMSIIRLNQDLRLQVEQKRLSMIVNYASDAAVLDMIGSADLQMDYMNINYMEVNPQIALQKFVDMFCKSYEMSLCEENRKHVMLNYMPVFCVPTWDGYYMATLQVTSNATTYPDNELDTATTGLVFSPKIPYTYMVDGESYALNLGGNYTYKIDGTTLSRQKGFPPGISNRTELLNVINSLLSTNVATEIDRMNASEAGWRNTFYLPAQLANGASTTNPVQGVSVMAIVQNVDLTSPRPVHTFSIAGSRIEAARLVACYIRRGIRYYCYADIMPTGVEIQKIVMTPTEAAEAGYACDTQYMS